MQIYKKVSSILTLLPHLLLTRVRLISAPCVRNASTPMHA